MDSNTPNQPSDDKPPAPSTDNSSPPSALDNIDNVNGTGNGVDMDKKQESAPTNAEGSTWKGSSSNMSSSSTSMERPMQQQATNGAATEVVTPESADAAVQAVMALTGETNATGNNEPSAFLTTGNTTTRGGNSRRGSSLELRKLPVNVLLRPEASKLFDEELSLDEGGDNLEANSRRNLLQRTCLNSKFTLRSQMMLSFGVISAGTILLVVIVCVAVSLSSGQVVKEKTRETFEHVASVLEARATRYIAEDLTPRLVIKDAVQILYETTKDRFYGYPVEGDSKVPFFDTLTQSNKYPIRGKPLPLDWQMDVNVNADNQEEHVQGRWNLYGKNASVSTANAAYVMQGMCDPEETDPSHVTYMEGCTEEHNNITTGGVFVPTPTNTDVHRKAADLVPLLKSLYEYHQDIKYVGIYFSNGGAGASATFPGTFLDGTSSYTSVGCDWLNDPHPLDPSRPILSPEEVERCSNNGTRVNGAKIPTRMYSPLDRGWCRDQVTNPGKLRIVGPYLDAWSTGVWLVSIGQALFDPNTKELVACLLFDVDVRSSLFAILANSQVTTNSPISVVQWAAEGTVVVSTAWDMSNATDTVAAWEVGIGVTQSAYEQFYHLVDFDDVWNSSEVEEKYEDFVVTNGGYQVKAYPIPPIPSEYDENYEPQFLVLVSVSEADIYLFADRVDNQVDERVQWLTILSVAVGMAGLVVVTAVLVAVANYITRPLRQMNETAIRIIDNFGEDSKIEAEDSTKEGKNEIVRTELTDIVKEFQRMVRKFSGGAMARSAKSDITEVDNQFQMMVDFQELYESRQAAKFKYRIPRPTASDDKENETNKVGRQHFGSNILSGSASTVRGSMSYSKLKDSRDNAYSSPLFRWIVALIVLPLLFSTISISTVVITSVSLELPDMIIFAERGLVDLQVSALAAFANLRAGFVSKTNEHAIRDLHVQTRYASWLLFGGLNANAFQEIVSAAEPCKDYASAPSSMECPYVAENHVCDCEWPPSSYPCFNYSDDGVDSRYLQVPYFIVSSQDADENGDRKKTSYPAVAEFPNATAWWESQFEVPGAPGFMNYTDDDEFLQGYDTTYRRLRSAASSPIYVPMESYESKEGNVLGTLVAFEADGMYLRYSGCSNMGHSANSQWLSTEQNEASELRPELCPVGLHGYDPRCRGWYASGRNSFLSDAAPLHVTPAYIYSDNVTGQSSTAPLFDPATGEHVGQVLVDFRSTQIFESLDDEHTPLAKDGFHLLITMESDVYGADLVIGPGLSITDPADDVLRVINAGEDFEEIVKSMKTGDRNTGKFVWEDEDGSPVTYHIAYSPVEVKSLRLIDSSNFSRGVQLEPYLLYSLALAEPEASMLDSFEAAEDDINGVIQIGLIVLCTVIVAASGLVVWLSHRITVSMTEPMYYLLELIRQINRLDVGEDPPEEDLGSGYGSSEVLNVRITMEKLYKIIQCANAAYFAGETEVAYEVFTDALHLFTRLDNRKAMGVANNNLGNTMLTFYRTMQATGGDTVCGLNRRQIIGKGMAYFHQAIQLGEKAYDAFYEAEGWSPKCLHFMQHLSNRYFNRAMFLLTVKDDHEKPKEIEELGMRDLQIARDMDVEIVDEGTQVGWDVRSAEAHLEVLLCRIRGHVTLLEMGYSNDWDVDEMLDNAFKILKTELTKDSTDLFNEVGPAGRMQQIEFLLMRYYIVDLELETAAKVAIRMLVEDEFILPEAQKEAIGVLISYSECEHVSPDVLRRLKEYQDWLQDAVDELDTQRSSKEAFENTRSSFVSNMAMSKRLFDLDRSNVNSVASLRESMRGDITMEAF